MDGVFILLFQTQEADRSVLLVHFIALESIREVRWYDLPVGLHSPNSICFMHHQKVEQCGGTIPIVKVQFVPLPQKTCLLGHDCLLQGRHLAFIFPDVQLKGACISMTSSDRYAELIDF